MIESYDVSEALLLLKEKDKWLFGKEPHPILRRIETFHIKQNHN